MRKRDEKRYELTRAERRHFEELVRAYYELDAVDLRRSTGTHVIAVPAEGSGRRSARPRRRRRWF